MNHCDQHNSVHLLFLVSVIQQDLLICQKLTGKIRIIRGGFLTFKTFQGLQSHLVMTVKKQHTNPPSLDELPSLNIQSQYNTYQSLTFSFKLVVVVVLVVVQYSILNRSLSLVCSDSKHFKNLFSLVFVQRPDANACCHCRLQVWPV